MFVYDWDGWATKWLSLFRYLLRTKWSDAELASKPLKSALVMASDFTHGTAALSRTFSNSELIHIRFPVTLPIEEIVAGINHAQPHFLTAYPSVLRVLSSEARVGRLRIAPRRILTTGEPLLPEIRADAETVWGVRVGNVYSSSEAGGVAVPCEHSRSHLSEDLMIVEAVDERGQPVAAGERAAKVYLTNLYNRALPLIRYELTDEVIVLAEPCHCGSAHRCIGDIQGRLDDMFVYDGRRIHPTCSARCSLAMRGWASTRSGRPIGERELRSDVTLRSTSQHSAGRSPGRSGPSASRVQRSTSTSWPGCLATREQPSSSDSYRSAASADGGVVRTERRPWAAHRASRRQRPRCPTCWTAYRRAECAPA